MDNKRTSVVSDSLFSNLFPKLHYDPSEISEPILDIWSSFRLQLNPADLSDDAYIKHEVTQIDTLYSISKLYYNTIELWWFVALMNDAVNPYTFLEDVLDGTWNGQGNPKVIKIMRPAYLPKIKRDMLYFKSLNEEQNRKLALEGRASEV
jgi:hypothetical protein